MKTFFPYSTLKQGYPLHFYLNGSRLINTRFVTPQAEWDLYSLGAFPGMKHVGDGGYKIAGELYEIPDGLVPILDAVEGLLFERRLLPPSLPKPEVSYYEYLHSAGDPIESKDGIKEWLGDGTTTRLQEGQIRWMVGA